MVQFVTHVPTIVESHLVVIPQSRFGFSAPRGSTDPGIPMEAKDLHYLRCGRARSVSGNRRVDRLGPGIDAAGQIAHLAEAAFLQELERLTAAHSGAAE